MSTGYGRAADGCEFGPSASPRHRVEARSGPRAALRHGIVRVPPEGTARRERILRGRVLEVCERPVFGNDAQQLEVF